jgi:hypothetical protein
MSRRVVLMEKGGVLGAVGVHEVDGFEVIRTYDSRVGLKAGDRAQVLVTAGYSEPIVSREVGRSVERGWRVFYDGPPLKG